MATNLSAMRHVRGFDVVKPLSITVMIVVMLPLILLPLASIFIFGTGKGLASFWGRNAVIVTISLPTAIPTAVAGFALLLLWGPYGTLGRLLDPKGVHLMFTAYAIILANIFVTFPLAFGVIKPVFDTMSRSLEEASATMGASRWQTFWHVTLPSLRGAIVSGALLTFARAVGEFGSTILVSGNLASRTQTAPLYIFAKFNEGQVEAANAIAIVLALLSFVIFSILFFARDWFDAD